MKSPIFQNIQAYVVDEDKDRLQLSGTLDEIKEKLLKLKFSHVSCYWTGRDLIPIREINDRLLESYDSDAKKVLYLYYGFIDRLKWQFTSLSGPSEPHPLWPVKDKLYVVKTTVSRTNFWIGYDPLYPVIGIPLDPDFTFIQKLIAYLSVLPRGSGRQKTLEAVERFYEENGLPKDYYHPGYEKPDYAKYYGLKF